jgi:hypothetical protein
MEELINTYYKEAVKGINENTLKDENTWYQYVVNLPEHLAIIYTIAIFDSQVINGGLHQYFLNGYGQFASITIENLKKIKAFKIANILSKALLEINNENLDANIFRKKVFNKQVKLA